MKLPDRSVLGFIAVPKARYSRGPAVAAVICEGQFATLLGRSRRLPRRSVEGHQNQFPPKCLSVRCGFGQGTFAWTQAEALDHIDALLAFGFVEQSGEGSERRIRISELGHRYIKD